MDEKDWDNVAASFDEDIFNVPANDRQGLITAAVKAFAGKGRMAADVGCGIGRTVPLLAQHFGTVIASDISGECLTVAERRYSTYPNVRYVHADLADPGLELPQADFVLCINVLLLESLAKRQVMMRNICSAVAQGGRLLIVTPAVESALYTSHRLVRLNEERGMAPLRAQQKAERGTSRLDMGIVMIDGVPTKHYLREELHDMLTAQGLHILSTEKIEYPWAYALDEPPADLSAPFPWNWMVVAERRD